MRAGEGQPLALRIISAPFPQPSPREERGERERAPKRCDVRDWDKNLGGRTSYDGHCSRPVVRCNFRAFFCGEVSMIAKSRSLSVFFLRIGVLLTLISATSAQAESLWDHNGSVVYLEANGASRKFFYKVPRRGLPVKPGTLLFRGAKQGNNYSGTAFVFSNDCGAIGYRVAGTVSADDRTVTMWGKAPRRGHGCRVTGYVDDVIMFTFLGPPDEPQASAEMQMGGARAQCDGSDKSEEPLQDFTGIWARTSNRCDLDIRKITGAWPLSLRNVDKATASKFHMIGICGNGFDLVRQPVGCIASKVVGRNKIVEFSAACRVKDYPTKHLKIRIRVLGKDRITFNKEDFDEDYFYIDGEYRRCSRSFACEEGPSTQLAQVTPQKRSLVRIDWRSSYEGALYGKVLELVPGAKQMAEDWDGVDLRTAQVDLDGDGKNRILVRTPVVTDGLYPGYPGDPTAVLRVGADAA